MRSHNVGRICIRTDVEEFEEKFKAADKGSVMCADLRGKVPGSCRACVTDAAKILEEMIG